MKLRIGLRKDTGVVYKISGTEKELRDLANAVIGLLWTGVKAVEAQIGDKLIVVEKGDTWQRSSASRSHAKSKRD